MKTVIIVSKCLATFPDGTARFHFKGVAAGEKVKDVMLFTQGDKMKAGETYAMSIAFHGIVKGTLTGQIIRFKHLEEEAEDNSIEEGLNNYYDDKDRKRGLLK